MLHLSKDEKRFTLKSILAFFLDSIAGLKRTLSLPVELSRWVFPMAVDLADPEKESPPKNLLNKD
jgi:hypothetical protein